MSDEPKVEGAIRILKDYGVEVSVRCLSAHRAASALESYIEELNQNGTEVIIAAAGMAAALPGVIASKTIIPVIGVPLSIVQMPSGIPVATVAINGTKNAAYLALSILSNRHESVKEKLLAYRKQMMEDALTANESLIEKY